jgi:hypothetical protein
VEAHGLQPCEKELRLRRLQPLWPERLLARLEAVPSTAEKPYQGRTHEKA